MPHAVAAWLRVAVAPSLSLLLQQQACQNLPGEQRTAEDTALAYACMQLVWSSVRCLFAAVLLFGSFPHTCKCALHSCSACMHARVHACMHA